LEAILQDDTPTDPLGDAQDNVGMCAEADQFHMRSPRIRLAN